MLNTISCPDPRRLAVLLPADDAEGVRKQVLPTNRKQQGNLRSRDDTTILTPIDRVYALWETRYRSSGKGLQVCFLQTQCYAGNVEKLVDQMTKLIFMTSILVSPNSRCRAWLPFLATGARNHGLGQA